MKEERVRGVRERGETVWEGEGSGAAARAAMEMEAMERAAAGWAAGKGVVAMGGSAAVVVMGAGRRARNQAPLHTGCSH